jgi:pimeloyl-ACP methyl ester carboxylesterase
MWDAQVNYFSHRHTVVRLDLPGYGQSDPPTKPYVPPESLYALLQYLKIERACVIGLSIGGTIAVDLAVAHPNAVSALVVVAGSPAWIAYSDGMAQRTKAIATAGRQDGPASIVEGWLNDPMLAVARTQPRFARQMRVFLSENAAGLLGLPFMRSPNIPLPKLTDLRMPVLVIAGDRDDPEIVERSRMLSREIPGARSVIIKDADHMVNLEKPREFNRALDGFLRGLKLQ